MIIMILMLTVAANIMIRQVMTVAAQGNVPKVLLLLFLLTLLLLLPFLYPIRVNQSSTEHCWH